VGFDGFCLFCGMMAMKIGFVKTYQSMGSTSAGWIHAWLNRRFLRLDHVWPEYDYICKNTNVLMSYRELFLCPKQMVHNPTRSTKRLKQSDSAEMTLAKQTATRSTEPECKNQLSQHILYG
jgi:hypothetical protein